MISWKKIVSRVRIIINECDTSENTFTVETDLSIEEFIHQAISLLMLHPSYSGTPTTVDSSDFTFRERPDGLFCALITLPDTFQQLVSVSLTSWTRPVYELLPTSDPRYFDQYTAAAGIGAGPNAPLAFFVQGTRTKHIEAHAVAKKDNVTYSLTYLATPSVDGDNLGMDGRYAYPLSYLAASLFLQSVGESEASQSALQTAYTFLQNNTYNTPQ